MCKYPSHFVALLSISSSWPKRRMKNLVFLTLCICKFTNFNLTVLFHELKSIIGVVNVLAKTGTGTSTANCPALGICNAVYNNALTVLRADDGDVIAPSDGQSCSDLLADCTGDGCSSCKCPADADTFNNDKERCENYDKSEYHHYTLFSILLFATFL